MVVQTCFGDREVFVRTTHEAVRQSARGSTARLPGSAARPAVAIVQTSRAGVAPMGEQPRIRCGATGYIGGTVLDTLVQQHPEYDITVLLRSEPTKFRQRYPNVQIMRGDYDGGDVLSEQASKAEIVIRGSAAPIPPGLL
ncbi:hypothetical protein LTR53_014719 [Teratosphaeriaceae sp. CCFEE 6253]|nr:hypothetical protein LTR53_014719 [Teratosphaeriaceae sp. CCFEE 6253]